jgi:hypothetical protein
MFTVTEAEAAAIRTAFDQGGEFAAALELRRLFPGVTDKPARECARTVAGWRPRRLTDFPLTARQTVIRDAVTTGQPFVAPDLARLLRGYGPPACYLDFEAMMPPIPLYKGT